MQDKDCLPETVRLPEPNDGFLLVGSYLPAHPTSFWSKAVQAIEVLRRANGYWPKWIVFPDPGQLVPAFGIIERQFRVPGGSILWGMSATMLNSSRVPVRPEGIYINITDNCLNFPLSEDFVHLASFWTGGQPYGACQYVFDSPRIFPGPGLLTVELANSTSSDARVQVALLFAQPCEHTLVSIRAERMRQGLPAPEIGEGK